jgi:transcriptional regulator with XRE-family HTH domain
MPKPDSVLAKLGLNVRKRREARELTQETLAERASLDPTYISGIERGLRNPGIKNVAKLAKALGLSTAELCKGVDS